MARLRILAVLVALGLVGCCELYGGEPSYLVAVERSQTRWSGRTVVQPGGTPFVTFVRWEPTETPSPEMLEFYDGDERLGIVGQLMLDGPMDSEDCAGSDQLVYDLSSLAPGDYLMVHRTSSAPEPITLATTIAESLTTFEGEAALVTTLVVGGGASDAGVSDAGP